MNLPIYHQITLQNTNLEDLDRMLNPELNSRQPVAFNLLMLDLDQQREAIGVIENFYDSSNISFKFPYPVYLVSLHETTITRMPMVRRPDELPRFFAQKESRMNVKETHVAGRNKLIQQEIRNIDASAASEDLAAYAKTHRQIYELESERLFLRDILGRLTKAKNG